MRPRWRRAILSSFWSTGHSRSCRLLVIQGTKDDNLTDDMAQRFVDAYRAAGGDAALEIYEGKPHAFVILEQGAVTSEDAIAKMAAFICARAR